jgi:hypothetical protein
MTESDELLLNRATVKITTADNNPIGSGFIYYDENLKDTAYILTAAHCLYRDKDTFTSLYDYIEIHILSKSGIYQNIRYEVSEALLSTTNDVAVMILNKKSIEDIVGEIPKIKAINHNINASSYVAKGFPSATKGKELVCISPSWIQSSSQPSEFQLRMEDDYTETYTQGFSGSGICCVVNNCFYLLGIFTRYRSEERGRVIYCKYLSPIDEVLRSNFKRPISFSFIGANGLDADFFRDQVATAITNLGPRFNETINFKLDIAWHFNSIAKDSHFVARFLHYCEDWLKDSSSFRYVQSDIVSDIYAKLLTAKQQVIDWASNINWATDKVDTTDIAKQISSLNKQIDEKREELYKHEERQDNPDGSCRFIYKYDKESYELLRLQRANQELLSRIESIDVKLINHPVLIIKGIAGCGKSHLLGDIATERTKNSHPTLLLLGQLFKSGQNVWQNILAQLGLSCSKEELLENLNGIGKQIGSRFMILIDAINEGAGKELWVNEISGFINEVRKYPNIGLVLTIRDTYYDLIIPEEIKTSSEVTTVTHHGFSGNEYEALRLFCKHYELILPSFPILTPEFSNPLFLHLTCQGLVSEGMRDFPKGFNGISSVFNRYINALNKKFAHKREEYRLYPKIIDEVIAVYVDYCIEHNDYAQLIKFSEARELFKEKFPDLKYILLDLIEESFFIKSNFRDYEMEGEEEYIYVSYERIGDYLIGSRVVAQCNTFDELATLFVENGAWDLSARGFEWNRYRLLEILAVLIPEKFNKELVEMYGWLFEKTEFEDYEAQNHLLRDVLNSLKWRETTTINDKVIVEYLQKSNYSYDEYLYTLCELTPIHNHPFNSDRLTQVLFARTMPERDSFWQRHMFNYCGKNDNDVAFPLRALIDWAWESKNVENADPETARLVAQTLVWTLSSTNNEFRDQATKALVCLLEEHISVLIQVLKTFKDIDDPYISERLYAIAYGCALRTTNKEGRNTLAQFVYDEIFKEGNPPKHLLLRDYARNTIEYSVYEGYTLSGDMKLVRPPYNSKMPDSFPTEKDIERYNIDNNAPNYKRDFGHANNQIAFSVLTWDFGRYTIGSAIGHFDLVNLTLEEQYNEFTKRLPRTRQKTLRLIQQLYTHLNSERVQNNLRRQSGEDRAIFVNSTAKDCLQVLTDEIKKHLSPEDYSFFETKFFEYYDSLLLRTNSSISGLNPHPYKCWIVQRVFELGYDSKLHGEYDELANRWSDRIYSHRTRTERIGKKYQWIAFFEILSMLADNYKIAERYGDRKNHIYEGPWELMCRNIDPAMIDRTKFSEDEDSPNPPDWRFDVDYPHWNKHIPDWVNNKNDLIDPKGLISRIDEYGEEWLSLYAFKAWREPKKLGKDRYTDSREIWYMLFPYLIKRSDKNRMMAWAHKQDFTGRWLPEYNYGSTDLINREHYWSPISIQQFKEEKDWEYIRDTKFRVIIPTVPATGEMSEDKSGTHFEYRIPWRPLFTGLNLRYSKKDGDLVDKDGNVVVTTGPNNEITLIRRDLLLKYLNENDLDIVWMLLGEKQAKTNDDRDRYSINTINGVVCLSDENELTGGITSLIKWS